MAITLHVVARDATNAVRNALTTPPSDAAVREAFASVERGIFPDANGQHSRTALNGGWIGAFAIARPDGAIEASRTWHLTDAQQQASGITNVAALHAFAQRLTNDLTTALVQRDTRPSTNAAGFWTVTATVRPSDGSVGANDLVTAPAEASSLGTWVVGGLVVAGLAWVFWPKGT